MLVDHPELGPHIRAWRQNGAVSRRGKIGALLGFAFSAALGFLMLEFPFSLIPSAAGVIGGTWIWTRPER